MSTEIHALSGAYALDALDADERAEFERHLADCASCRAEVESLREAAALMSEVTQTPAPPGLRDRVLADASAVRPLPPVVERAPRPARARPRRLLVAAAAAAVLAGGGVAWHPWDRPSSPVVSAVDRVSHAPDAQRASQTVAGGGSITVYRSASLDAAVVVVRDLPALSGGKVYQMWLQDPKGSMAPAGLVPAGRRSGEMVLDGPARAAVGVGMTVEPAGGSAAPTSAPVALVALGRA